MKFEFSSHSIDNPTVKWMLYQSILFCVAFTLTTSTVYAQTVVTPVFNNVDFDGTGAPSNFADTIALSNEFAAQDVIFSGPGELDGGGILNQAGNFGIQARSGTDFLAFNRVAQYLGGGTPVGPLAISFDSRVDFVSIFASGGDNSTSFTIDAYRLDGLVGSRTFNASAAVWTELLISSEDVAGDIGFDSVVISENSNRDAFVYDDLSFTTAVPEPGSALIVVLCTGLASLTRKRTK